MNNGFTRFLALALTAIMAFAACSEEKKKQVLLPNISGKAGEVIVVINKTDWEGAIGTVLRDSLACECPFLPQREPMFNLVNVAPSGFTNMFQIHRNIIVVNISESVTEPGVIYKKDIWARPQTVIYINAIDSDSAVMLIEENSSRMTAVFEQAERDRIIANAKKYEERKLAPIVSELTGGSPHFPSGYQLKKKTNDFIWISYDIQYVSQGILIYKYPVVPGEQMLDLENIMSVNERMLRENVPGMFDNTYMITSGYVQPSIEYKKYKGIEFAEIRGLWEVYNDAMGGPFVTHAFYSRDGKDVIVLEGFVYAPKYDKRQYLRQVESILYSFEWDKNEKTE